ncbi:hypothetical protein [Cellulomonas soli]
MDAELSDAIGPYFSRGHSPYPRVDRQAAGATARKRAPEVLVREIESLVAEMNSIPVDWMELGYERGCRYVIDSMARRHPELTSAAMKTLGWNFSYVNR